ncbi:MAG: aminotransferase class I/II-fold pyridoxal phosphate-dependent enzyme [Eubacteriales bacterium]|nr:aminotransferase class I/II-fold pyridoxal phosphate-dependent enzyme [Eubacteriales bacterium]MDD4582903.1 aminotransferase class I/II-fold pyridoxal phosphate-dependent enzyme [Eubacteriales bacterium]
MTRFIMAEENSRIITGEDKIFGINKQAQEMISKVGREKVANATIGSLLDDNGNLVILSSVVDVMKDLKPNDYAEYAPIAGVPAFLDAAVKSVFMDYTPKGYINAVATPGGTGAIRNAVQNYTKRGDVIMTSSWYWNPYMTIAQELERDLETYPLFNDNNLFNTDAFEEKMKEILSNQDRLVVIINTPCHNPTGYSLTLEDWDQVLCAMKKAASDQSKKIVFLVDAAYLDFAGDAKMSRAFLPKLDGLPENLLPLIAFSMSKSFTLYGMRGGALICLSPNKEITNEFKLVNSFSNRGTWSNGTRAAMVTLSRIYKNDTLLEKVVKEREAALSMLIRRGKAFQHASEKVGLVTSPYDSGFFVIVPCKNPEQVGEELQKDGIFTVPFGGKGLRVSVASISEEWCSIIPGKMAAAIKKING